MRRQHALSLTFTLGACLLLAPGSRAAGPAGGAVILATTTSLQDTGLLDVLLPLFTRQTGYRVKPVAVGSGAALALGARGEADVVIAHSQKAELAWMASGHGSSRLRVMHNDFLLVGPAGDPAAVRGSRAVVRALERVSRASAPFVSRDDGSGTHALEQTLWKEAGIAPAGRPWYVRAGQGMGATLTMADQKRAYTLTDRSTFLARRATLGLVAMVEGDDRLLNVYHVLVVAPSRIPAGRGNLRGGEAFARFLVSPEAQRVIGEFGRARLGQALFVPDAAKAR